MNILILGGRQACRPELSDGKSYVAQFARRLQAGGQPVQIDCRFVSLSEAGGLLPRLRLAEYDLILLQFDLPVNWLPAKPADRLLMEIKLCLNGHRAARLNALRTQLAHVLLQVRVFNRQVVLLSPLPHRRALEQWFLARAEAVHAQESREWQVPFFNVRRHLPGGDELFQPGSDHHLSAVAHELLASELHTFITEPTFTLWP